MQKTVTLKKIYHRNADRIGIYFGYDEEIKAHVKYAGALYSKTNRCFHLPYTRASLKTLLKDLKGVAQVDMEDIYIQEGKRQAPKPVPEKKAVQSQRGTKRELKNLVPEEFEKILKRRRYSPNTVRTYMNFLNQYLNFISPKIGSDSGEEDVKRFMYYLVKERKVATSTQNQAVNAIKFYFEHYLGREKKNFYIERPIKEKRLPRVLSEEEIIKMIVAARNLKHQCIIAMLYSAGLRRGELLNLRKEDISFDRQQVYIRAGKGKKDRVSVLSERMATALKKYLEAYKPNYWLFEGPERKQFSATSVGNIVKFASKKIGIAGITPHMLRHSFATHMMDRGTDTRVIQTLLGHERLETTAIYTHVSRKDLQKIKSPLDQIFESKTLDSNTLIN